MRPVLFSIGNLNIYTYGFFIACAFLISVFLAKRQAHKYNISADIITDLGIIFILAGIIGARIGYVLLHWEEFSSDLIGILKVYHGGLIFSTGFLLALTVSLIYIKKKKIKFLKVADCIIPYVVLGQAIGRIGCFFNGCCYGIPTDSFLGVKFPHLQYSVYPTQLFSSAFLFILFFILKYLKRFLHFTGAIFYLYILFYSMFRFFMDYIRADAIFIYGRLSFFQYITIVIFLVTLVFFLHKIFKVKDESI